MTSLWPADDAEPAGDPAGAGTRRGDGPDGAADDAAGRRAPRYARVAPPLPVDGLFTYAVPESLAGRVVPGVRAVVPFGRRKLTAMVVAVGDEPPPAGVPARPLLGLVEDDPLVGADILALARWVARRTACSPGEALDATLPRAVRSGRTARTVEEVELAIAEEAVPGRVEELLGRRSKQARTLRILADRGGRLTVRELMSLARVSRSPVTSLESAGLVRTRRRRLEHDLLDGAPVARRGPLVLTDEQRLAYERVVAAADRVFGGGRGAETPDRGDAGASGRPEPPVDGPVGPAADGAPVRPLLLHGVTGSGKTEVYLQALDHVVRAGRQGIVLVPEISLTPQTVRRFRERFDRVAVLHSQLTDAERHDQWRRIRAGEADVVVGARSAVFAPVPRLGLVVLDEEHETSFKQNNVPRYHARDVAVERARLTGAVCLLGTATPSLEAWHRAGTGEYELLRLVHRVAGGRSPEVAVVDLTVEERRRNSTYLSDQLVASMEDALARGGQVILFLNRRGWATVMLCRTCHAPLRCPSCDVSLTFHRRIRRVLCHYCGHEEPPPADCPACRGRLGPLGYGTEKVEDEVRHVFPGVSVARMDSDTMSGRGAHATVLDAFGRGEVQVLVGTQMIAKGLDFPNAVLVGVLCADAPLFLPDWRATERTFQLLAQVIGRTGRGPLGGRVVVQAYDVRHFAVRTGVAQDVEAFARVELVSREDLGYPPFGRLLRIVVHARVFGDAMARAGELALRLGAGAGAPSEAGGGEVEAGGGDAAADATATTAGGARAVEGKPPRPAEAVAEAEGGAGRPKRAAAGANGGTGRGSSREAGPARDVAAEAPIPGVTLLGPAPAPIPRINRQHRVHLAAKCIDDAAVEAVLGRLAGHIAPARGTRVLVDVDPMNML